MGSASPRAPQKSAPPRGQQLREKDAREDAVDQEVPLRIALRDGQVPPRADLQRARVGKVVDSVVFGRLKDRISQHLNRKARANSAEQNAVAAHGPRADPRLARQQQALGLDPDVEGVRQDHHGDEDVNQLNQ